MNKKPKPKQNQTITRKLKLDLSQSEIDAEARAVRNVSFSSDTALPDFLFGALRLNHSPKSVDMSRAVDGNLPLMDNHQNRIGLIKNFQTDGEKTRGDAYFSQRPEAMAIFNDIQDGLLTETSIRANINRDKLTEFDDFYQADEWQPIEGSFVDIPADVSTGVNRNFEGEQMETNDSVTPSTTGTSDSKQDFGDFITARKQGESAGRAEARKDIQRDLTEINKMFSSWENRAPIFRDAKNYAIEQVYTMDRARDLLNECIDKHYAEVEALQTITRQAEGSQYRQGETANPFIQGGADNVDKKLEAISDSMELRAMRSILGVMTPAAESQAPNQQFKSGAYQRAISRVRALEEKAKQNEFTGFNMTEIARAWAAAARVNIKGMDVRRALGEVLIQREILGHSTGSFTSLLENIVNKSIQIGYEEAAETWQRWCSVGELPNFLQGSRPNLSAFSDLDELPESGEMKEGTFTDIAEKIQLATFAKLFSITRQALINDDVNGFSRIPLAMGRAASRAVGDTVYAHLINGHTRTLDQDSTALFAAGHSNYVASGSGAAPSDATIQAAKTAMATQTDPSGNASLNIMLAYLLVPWALIGTATKLQKADYNPVVVGTDAGSREINIHQGTFEPIADARLDADSATKWYGAANPFQIATIEVAFLNGNQAPMIEQVNAWNVDGVKYKVIHDHAAEPLDFRGFYLNWGS